MAARALSSWNAGCVIALIRGSPKVRQVEPGSTWLGQVAPGFIRPWLDPPGLTWTCPKSKRTFADPRQWHSCRQGPSVGAHLEGRPERQRKAFDKIVKALEKECAPRVDAVASAIHMAAGSTFAPEAEAFHASGERPPGRARRKRAHHEAAEAQREPARGRGRAWFGARGGPRASRLAQARVPTPRRVQIVPPGSPPARGVPDGHGPLMFGGIDAFRRAFGP